MLEKVPSKQGTPSRSVQQRARDLGLSIQSLGKALRWLKEVESTCEQTQESKTKIASQPLKSPFLKIEDHSRSYQPVHTELKQFPRVNLMTRFDQSPYDEIYNLVIPPVTSSAVLQNFSKRPSSTSKKGYCELCNVQYTHRGQHLKGRKHQSMITSEHFQRLDEMIARGGKFDSLIYDLRNKKKSSQQKRKSPRQIHRKNLSSNSTAKTITPLQVRFSPTNGYTVKKIPTRRQVSFEPPDTATLDNYSCMQVDDLTLKLKRAPRHRGDVKRKNVTQNR
ncbi:protein DBF4 homolog B-like [Hydractinia symbiolongicarpus]|uniref:protein DBF4 homolog B-like n=1 Tax=Hydractinia symbiolongicarpus TaxID=13093 RepID=UPI002551138C|nr:protein DBF4 homolog B-like [Hydractinia symbiolongicarpus]XP_057306209.1 protein DBF4 homolog B-like [Hydractinia symbiolongicarpus]